MREKKLPSQTLPDFQFPGGATIFQPNKKGRCSQLSQLALFTAAVFPPYRHRNC